MGLRVPWQNQYLICQSSTISEANDFSAGSMGIELSKYALPLTNHPHLASGQNIINTEKSLGKAARRAGVGYEYQAGTRLPVVTIESDYTAHLGSLLLWLLHQNGASEAAGPNYVKTYQVWTDSSPEIYCNIAKVMSDDSADSFRIRGGICRSVTIFGREGEQWKISAEIVGAYYDSDFNATSIVATFSERTPVMFSDISSVTVQSLPNRVIEQFTMTVNNNAISKYYNSQIPASFVLGKLTGTCSFVCMWGESHVGGQYFTNLMKNGTAMRIIASTITGDFQSSFEVNGVITGVEILDEEQNKVKVDMEIAWKATDPAAFIQVRDKQSRGIT